LKYHNTLKVEGVPTLPGQQTLQPGKRQS